MRDRKFHMRTPARRAGQANTLFSQPTKLAVGTKRAPLPTTRPRKQNNWRPAFSSPARDDYWSSLGCVIDIIDCVCWSIHHRLCPMTILLQNLFVVYVLFVLYEIDTNISCEDQGKLLGTPREDRSRRFRSDGLWRRAASKVIPTLVPPTAIWAGPSPLFTKLQHPIFLRKNNPHEPSIRVISRYVW